MTSPANMLLTNAIIAAIAEKVSGSVGMTVTGACVELGYAKYRNTIKQAMWRVQHDKASDDEMEKFAPLIKAIEANCRQLMESGLGQEVMGQRTAMVQFVLEKLNPCEYGKSLQKVALTDSDGNDLVNKSPKELLAMMADLEKIAKGDE